MRNPLQNLLTILIGLDLRDLEFAGCNADGYALAIALLARHALDVDDVFQAVDGDDLAFAAFVCAAFDDYFVVFADGDCADLLLEVDLVSGCVGSVRGGQDIRCAFLLVLQFVSIISYMLGL